MKEQTCINPQFFEVLPEEKNSGSKSQTAKDLLD